MLGGILRYKICEIGKTTETESDSVVRKNTMYSFQFVRGREIIKYRIWCVGAVAGAFDEVCRQRKETQCQPIQKARSLSSKKEKTERNSCNPNLCCT
jgi:hypothetical protein